MDPLVLPVIDFARLNSSSSPPNLRAVCETHGAFYLLNHRVDVHHFYAVLLKQLFDLPRDEKLQLYPGSFGQGAPGGENEVFFLGPAELQYNSELQRIYAQCREVKRELLERIGTRQHPRQRETGDEDCFQLIHSLDAPAAALTCLKANFYLLLQLHFPSISVESECLLVTVGAGLFPERAAEGKQFEHEPSLFDIRFLAYQWELEDDERTLLSSESSSSSIVSPIPPMSDAHSAVELYSRTSSFVSKHADEQPSKGKEAASPPRCYYLSLTERKWLRYFTFFYLYVMQGIPAGFSGVALANYLTAEGKESSTVGTFISVSALPWALQFVWGPLIDRFQTSAMGRRRPWVIGSQLAAFTASLGLLLVSNPIEHYVVRLAMAFCFHSVFASIQDASVDAQAITVIPVRERGRINGFMRGGMLVGSAAGSAGLSYVLRHYGYFHAASLVCSTLLLFTILTFFIKEKSSDALLSCRRSERRGHIRSEKQLSLFWLFQELFRGLLAKKSLKLFVPIALCYLCQSVFIKAYVFNLINQLGWTDTSVSVMSGLWGTGIVIGVVLIGGYLSDKVGAGRLLVIVTLLHGLYMVSINLLSDSWSDPRVATAGLILWSFMDPLLSVSSMPILMNLCRSHVEGSQFTTYMSLVNLCDITGSFISGHLQVYLRAHQIGFGCAVFILLAFIAATITIYGNERAQPPVVLEDEEKEQQVEAIIPTPCQ